MKFLVLNISQKILEKCIGKKSIVTNIFRIQAYDSIYGYFCTVSTNVKLKNKRLKDFTILFSTKNFKEHDKNVSIFLIIFIIFNKIYMTLIIYIHISIKY